MSYGCEWVAQSRCGGGDKWRLCGTKVAHVRAASVLYSWLRRMATSQFPIIGSASFGFHIRIPSHARGLGFCSRLELSLGLVRR
jgi:hypothetical protein